MISYDSPEVLAAFTERYGVTFPMLSDVGSATIRRYGLLNTVADAAMDPDLGDLSNDPVLAADFERLVSVTQPSARFQGIAIPGTFILDPEGRVTARFFEDFYRERNTVANVMLRLGQGGNPVAGSSVATNHLELTSYASDSIVALGDRFSLVLDVAPGPNMHVYAPGAVNYRVISLTLNDQPFVRALPMQFPESEIYYFEPFDECVPVYQQPFRLVQEVVPEITQEAQAAFRDQDELTITGTFDYQACDDRICYNPVSMPLSWTVSIRPFAHRPSSDSPSAQRRALPEAMESDRLRALTDPSH